MDLKSFSELSEARGDTAVFCIGRFNPPTIGHLKMIEAAASQQSKYSGAPFYVFPTHSQDPAKNPLPHSLKIAYMKKMFKKYAKNIQVSKARNLFEMATMLHDKGHRAVVLVAGSDRVDEFQNMLDKYNGVEGRHGYYGFDSIEVKSAGERDPDAEGVEGMSASKMRAAASSGDYDAFTEGLPSNFKDAKKLFRDVRKHMGIREERDMGNMDDYETLRDAYLTGKIWNINDLVEANGIEGRVVNRGTNYIAYMDGSGKVHKAWLYDIALNERNYRKEYDNYHSRPDQIERRSSRNKARRAMGDNAVKGMDVGHKDNNPLNNDPKNLRNEDPTKNRREPRLREEEELDENWFDALMAKIDQMRHPKGYDNMVKRYVQLVKDKGGTQDRDAGSIKVNNPTALAVDVANSTGAPVRGFISYINKLVKKGVLPKELKAQVQTEHHIVEGLTMMVKGTKNTSQRKYQLSYDQKIKIDGKIWNTEGVTKMQVLPVTDGQSTIVLTKKQIEAGLKKGTIEIIDTGDIWQPEEYTFKDLVNQINEVKQDKDIEDRKGTQPAKYYAKDTEGDEMAPSTKQKRAAHFAKKKKGPAPGDKSAKTKPSQHTKKFKQMYGEKLGKNADMGDYIDDFEKSDAPQFKGKSKEKRKDMAIAAYLDKNEAYQLDEKIAALVKKAEKSGMPYSILKKVYDRGMAAYKTGHRPGATPQQWALARVNSFTTKSSGTWGKADKDLAKQVRGEGLEEDGPCWDTHKQVGMKKKGGKMVPNCVPKNEDAELNEWGEVTEKAEYNGRPVDLNNPTKGDVKKYKVYVKNEKGNVVKVEFGDPNMEIKRDDPKNRANFRARHNCDNPGPKYKARYWSCKFWSAKSVTDLMKG